MDNPCAICNGTGCEACDGTGMETCAPGSSGSALDWDGDCEYSGEDFGLDVVPIPSKTKDQELDEVLAEIYDLTFKSREMDAQERERRLAEALGKYKNLTGQEQPAFRRNK